MSENSGGQASCHTPSARLDRTRSSRWGQEGVLVTDDFSMSAVYRQQAGIAAAGVAALNAGVDQILVSYDPTQYFTMMNALITANRAGGLTPATLARSARRLAGTAR